MSKILIATSDGAGKVMAEGFVLPEAMILSKGTKAAQGILFIDGDKLFFMPSSATDIEDLITRLVAIVQQMGVALTGLDSVTTSPGSAAAAIAQIEVLKTQLDASKGSLK